MKGVCLFVWSGGWDGIFWLEEFGISGGLGIYGRWGMEDNEDWGLGGDGRWSLGSGESGEEWMVYVLSGRGRVIGSDG